MKSTIMNSDHSDFLQVNEDAMVSDVDITRRNSLKAEVLDDFQTVILMDDSLDLQKIIEL